MYFARSQFERKSIKKIEGAVLHGILSLSGKRQPPSGIEHDMIRYDILQH
jgi:hypothetical protein